MLPYPEIIVISAPLNNDSNHYFIIMTLKRIRISVLFLAIISFASCGSMSNIASSDTAAMIEGTSCGKSLENLYTQYKSLGKVDLSSASNLLKVAELGTFMNSLKNNINLPAYKTDFLSGLVSGSNGLITENNSSAILNSLTSLNGLSSITPSTESTSTLASSVSSGLGDIFKSIKH